MPIGVYERKLVICDECGKETKSLNGHKFLAHNISEEVRLKTIQLLHSKITCGECGKTTNSIGGHKKLAHNMSKEKRSHFGNQYAFGKRWKLSKESRKNQSRAMTARMDHGVYDKTGRGKIGFRKDLNLLCRSTWEANFARILNHENIKYEYEKYYFNTSLGTYTPDFYLPDKDIYVEIKGYEKLNSEQKRKRIECRKKYGVKIKMIRLEQYKRLQDKYILLISSWEM